MRFILIQLFTFTTLSLLAQYSFNISESNYSFAKGSHHGFSITIYETSSNDIEKEWKKLMKDWHGKVDEKKHEFFADDATLKSMGENSFDTYAFCSEKDNSIHFIAAVDLGGAYLNSSQHKDQATAFKKELMAFAKKVSQNGLDSKIKEAKHEEHQLEKDFNHLVKQEEKLKNDISDWEKSIQKAKDDIKSNAKEQEDKKQEITEQSKVVEGLDKRKKSIK
jgi:hypothetical protein